MENICFMFLFDKFWSDFFSVEENCDFGLGIDARPKKSYRWRQPRCETLARLVAASQASSQPPHSCLEALPCTQSQTLHSPIAYWSSTSPPQAPCKKISTDLPYPPKLGFQPCFVFLPCIAIANMPPTWQTILHLRKLPLRWQSASYLQMCFGHGH